MSDGKPSFLSSGNKGRRFLVFLCCVAMAFFMWLVHRLSLEYSSYFRYEVLVQTSLDGYTSGAEAEDLMLIKGKASGFYILKYRARRQLSCLTLQIAPRELRSSKSQLLRFAVAAPPLKERVAEQLDGEVEVEAVLVDSIHVLLKKVSAKKCKVAFNGTISYQSQYTSFVPMRMIPDSVTISGPDQVLQNMDSILITPVHLRNLDRDMQGVAELIIGDDLHCSVKEVKYEIQVSRYVERILKREVQVSDLPAGAKVLILPSQISIRFRAPYDTSEDSYSHYFRPVVPFSEVERSLGSTVIPEIRELPSMVSHISPDPPVVECIVQKANPQTSKSPNRQIIK